MEKKANNKIKIINEKGITIVALVITIIIMLILAGVGIKGITKENGLIGKTKKSKELAEIDSEKENVNIAMVQAMGKSIYGEIEKENLNEALMENLGEGKTEILKDGENFVVKFKESGRYYEINDEETIEGPIEVIIDEMPGDITKGGTRLGTEDSPYVINCIEDLVAVSIASNGGNTELEIEMKNGNKMKGIKSSNYSNTYIELARTLNFESELSYTNANRIDFGDINGDGKIENIKTELTSREGRGFIPINFRGTFDGKGNEVRNIYENVTRIEGTNLVGLFGNVDNGHIKKIGVTGNVEGNWFAGGVVANALNGTKIENCYNKAKVAGVTMVGGIAGYGRCISNANATIGSISNCQNYGEIIIISSSYGYGGCGGIVGNGGDVSNCDNYGIVQGDYYCGGIMGTADVNITIKNCVNSGNVVSDRTDNSIGGIIGRHMNYEVNVINCINKADISLSQYAGGIVGRSSGANWTSDLSLNIKNSYNGGNINSSGSAGGIIGRQATTCKTNYIGIENCYNVGKGSGTNYAGIIGSIGTRTETDTKTQISNAYYLSAVSNSDIITGTYTGTIERLEDSYMKSEEFVNKLNQNIGTNTEWKRWKYVAGKYPEFE